VIPIMEAVRPPERDGWDKPGHDGRESSMLKIRAPKDFWTGVMFVAFAAVALAASRNLTLGTALRMGPGYFPMLLGGLLGVIGLALMARALVLTGGPVARLRLGPLGVVVAAVVAFALLLPTLGLVVALVATIAITALASRESKPLEVAALAAGLALFSVLVFVYALRLPLPVWPQL
jgi:hypothetical protein